LRELAVIDSISPRIRSDRSDLKETATLLGMPTPGMVDYQPAHYVRGISHKSRAVGERRAVSRGDIKVCLVQERGRTETYRDALSREFTLGQPVQFGVKRCEQRFRGGPVTSLDSANK
jgi:hypothetical protein